MHLKQSASQLPRIIAVTALAVVLLTLSLRAQQPRAFTGPFAVSRPRSF